MNPRNGDGAPAQGPATSTYDAAPNASTRQGTAAHRHERGADLDGYGWSTCSSCGWLWHPSIRVLDGARARRRLRRAS